MTVCRVSGTLDAHDVLTIRPELRYVRRLWKTIRRGSQEAGMEMQSLGTEGLNSSGKGGMAQWKKFISRHSMNPAWEIWSYSLHYVPNASTANAKWPDGNLASAAPCLIQTDLYSTTLKNIRVSRPGSRLLSEDPSAQVVLRTISRVDANDNLGDTRPNFSPDRAHVFSVLNPFM